MRGGGEIDEVADAPLEVGAARAVTDQIRSAVARTIDVLGEVDVVVGRAYAGRVWIALGHSSWQAYCEHEISRARLWSTVTERQEATVRLRESGLSLRAVAAVMRVSDGTVRRDELKAHGPREYRGPQMRQPIFGWVWMDGCARLAVRTLAGACSDGEGR